MRKAEKKLTALVNTMASSGRVSTRGRRTRRNRTRTTGMTVTELPLQAGYNVRQTTRNQVVRMFAREQVGSVTFGPNTPVNSTVYFEMNPLKMNGTRIQRVSAAYQKYRFKRLALTVQSSSTTATNGLYVVGYNSNPDAELPRGREAQAIFSLPGAETANVWLTKTTVARLEDKSRWYNLDEDSLEVMQTTQGYFAVACQAPTSTTAPATYPVYLDYDVEFTGTSLNVLQEAVAQVFPAGTFSYNFGTGNFTFTADAGEPAMPSLTNGVVYELSPDYDVTVTDSAGGELQERVRYLVPTTLSWAWARTLEEAAEGGFVGANTTFYVDRVIVSRAFPN